MGKPWMFSSTTAGWPGFSPLTSTPKKGWPPRQFPAWNRGSRWLLVDTITKTRPSSAFFSIESGNETSNRNPGDWACVAGPVRTATTNAAPQNNEGDSRMERPLRGGWREEGGGMTGMSGKLGAQRERGERGRALGKAALMKVH